MKQIFFREVEHEVVAIKEGLEAEGKSVGVLKVTSGKISLLWGFKCHYNISIFKVTSKSGFKRSLQNHNYGG